MNTFGNQLDFLVVIQTKHSWNSARDTKADRALSVFHFMEWENECAGTRLGAVTGNPQNQTQRGSPSLTAALWGVDILSSLLLPSLCLSETCYILFRKMCYAVIWHMAWDIKVKEKTKGEKRLVRGKDVVSLLLTILIHMSGGGRDRREVWQKCRMKNDILRQKLYKGIITWMRRKKIYWQIRNEGRADSVEKKRWWVISMLVNNYISWSSFAQSFTTADLLSCKPSSLRVGNT